MCCVPRHGTSSHKSTTSLDTLLLACLAVPFRPSSLINQLASRVTQPAPASGVQALGLRSIDWALGMKESQKAVLACSQVLWMGGKLDGWLLLVWGCNLRF
jgi:hypothetical protein